MSDKPLFIPLRKQWFDAFASGEKVEEYRPYGPRWNEKTLWIGRAAVIANGYSGPGRLNRVVAGLRKISAAEAPEAARAIYPRCETFIAIALPPTAAI